MKIIVDAMGGDLAPDAIVKGAVDAVKEFGIEVVLVGQGEEILRCFSDLGLDTLPQGIEVANAEDVVLMEDEPRNVLHTRKDSSMVVGLRMLSENQGDAFVSAGNTGALLIASSLLVRRISGVRRAAFGPVIPTKTGNMVLIDCGANVECTPAFLMQFAILGSSYAKNVLGVQNPRVALLNNGTEACKGMDLQKETYELLTNANDKGLIHFIGNLEARDAMLGSADVLVADGFSGNIMLKAVEGTALFMSSELKRIFKKNLCTKLAALICYGGIKSLKKKMDYRETGGTAIIGLKKPVIKAHGSSDARAIRSAILQAKQYVEANVVEEIAASLKQLSCSEEQ